MTTLHTLVLVAHVFVGAMIIGLVLLQRGKGAEAGAAFGAGASATVFGAKGSANFLSRSPAVLATLFFATSLGLAYLGSKRPVAQSIVEQAAPAPVLEAQAPPGGTPEDLPELPSAPAAGSEAPAGGTPPPEPAP